MLSAKSCGDPGSPTNGNRVGWLFQYNQTVRFKCLEGYILEGPKARTCQANQTWSGIQPICKRKPDSHGIIKFILSSYFAWCILTNFSQVFFFPKCVIVSTSCSFFVVPCTIFRNSGCKIHDFKSIVMRKGRERIEEVSIFVYFRLRLSVASSSMPRDPQNMWSTTPFMLTKS